MDPRIDRTLFDALDRAVKKEIASLRKKKATRKFALKIGKSLFRCSSNYEAYCQSLIQLAKDCREAEKFVESSSAASRFEDQGTDEEDTDEEGMDVTAPSGGMDSSGLSGGGDMDSAGSMDTKAPSGGGGMVATGPSGSMAGMDVTASSGGRGMDASGRGMDASGPSGGGGMESAGPMDASGLSGGESMVATGSSGSMAVLDATRPAKKMDTNEGMKVSTGPAEEGRDSATEKIDTTGTTEKASAKKMLGAKVKEMPGAKVKKMPSAKNKNMLGSKDKKMPGANDFPAETIWLRRLRPLVGKKNNLHARGQRFQHGNGTSEDFFRYYNSYHLGLTKIAKPSRLVAKKANGSSSASKFDDKKSFIVQCMTSKGHAVKTKKKDISMATKRHPAVKCKNIAGQGMKTRKTTLAQGMKKNAAAQCIVDCMKKNFAAQGIVDCTKKNADAVKKIFAAQGIDSKNPAEHEEIASNSCFSTNSCCDTITDDSSIELLLADEVQAAEASNNERRKSTISSESGVGSAIRGNNNLEKFIAVKTRSDKIIANLMRVEKFNTTALMSTDKRIVAESSALVGDFPSAKVAAGTIEEETIDQSTSAEMMFATMKEIMADLKSFEELIQESHVMMTIPESADEEAVFAEQDEHGTLIVKELNLASSFEDIMSYSADDDLHMDYDVFAEMATLGVGVSAEGISSNMASFPDMASFAEGISAEGISAEGIFAGSNDGVAGHCDMTISDCHASDGRDLKTLARGDSTQPIDAEMPLFFAEGVFELGDAAAINSGCRASDWRAEPAKLSFPGSGHLKVKERPEQGEVSRPAGFGCRDWLIGNFVEKDIVAQAKADSEMNANNNVLFEQYPGHVFGSFMGSEKVSGSFMGSEKVSRPLVKRRRTRSSGCKKIFNH